MKKLFTLFIISFLLGFANAQVPTGYYDGTAGLTGAQLKTKLSEIISNGTKDNGYGGLYTGFPSTDTDSFYDNDGSVLDMYSENPTNPDPYNYQHGKKQCGNYENEADCYNREHVVPQSLFMKKPPMVSDIHFIRPTDGKVNGMRSNYPFAMVSNPSFTSKNGTKVGASSSAGYSGSACEPIDEFKGDIARMIFYFVTRYESKLSGFLSGNMLGSTSYPGLMEWEKDVLLTWAAQDPVSPAEIKRNDASYTFQGNRNPYIDHPEWVQQIWGTQVIDTESPSTPTNLVLISTTTASADLNWTASTDNIAVSYYKIFVDGVFKSNSPTNSATVSGLAQGSTFNFYVIAVDAAGNESGQSNTVVGTTLVDVTPPTAATNLTVVSTGSNNISVEWTAATDNVGIASYDVYLNGVLYESVDSTSSNIANLDPSTTYSIYVVAKDAAKNASPNSNTVTATTAAIGSTCGDENFETIPTSASNYTTYNWSSNGISWVSEDSRTDQTINSRAITIRNGSLTALSAPNGIKDLTITTQLKYSGTSDFLQLFINGEDTGKLIPYSSTPTTTTITDLNISGNVEIKLINRETTKNRVAIDDMKWSCYTNLAVNENNKTKNSSISIYPNPVKNKELNVNGKNLSEIENIQIFDLTGKLIQAIENPFKHSSKIKLNNLNKGVYILKTAKTSTKFIID